MTEIMKKRISRIVLIMDTICIAYFLLFMLWVFLWTDTHFGEMMIRSTKYINPFTTGVYITGAATICTLIFLRKIWLKIVMIMIYVVSALITIVATMGMESDWEIIPFMLIRILFVVAFIVVIAIKIMKKQND